MARNHIVQVDFRFTEGQLGLYTYSIYGLSVASEIDLHLPQILSEEVDVRVQVNSIANKQFDDGMRSDCFDEKYQRLYWPFAGSAEIYDANHVVITPLQDQNTAIFSLAILGPVIALILHSRRFTTLHASCTALGNKTAAFMGDKGAGKSTITAALVASGHRLYADDVAALSREGGCDFCKHGFPLMKLSGETLAAFPQLMAQGAKVLNAPIGGKHLVRLPPPQQSKLPLAGLFVLRQGLERHIKRLNTMDAFEQIMRFSYPIRFGPKILKLESSKEFARYAASLASEIPVYILTVDRGLDRLPESIEMIERAAADA